MKRFILLLLVVVVCTSAMFSCADEKDDRKPDLNISFDFESQFVPDNGDTSDKAGNIDGEGNGETPTDGNFSVRDKVYAFKGNNVALLSIINGTNKNYGITVNASFIDASGNVLKTQTKKWEKFASNTQHDFIFDPKIPFDKFEYTIDTVETDSPCYEGMVKYEIETIKKGRYLEFDANNNKFEYPTVEMMIGFSNFGSERLFVGTYDCVVFGNDGEIYDMSSWGVGYITPNETNFKSLDLYIAKDCEFVWPEILKDNVTLFCEIRDVKTVADE